MEGLIKGLMDVALGGGNRDDESRDERSRSTWAEVVSGKEDKDQDLDGDRTHWNRQEQNQGIHEQWEVECSRPPSWRPQKSAHEYVEIEGDKKDSYGQNQWHRKDNEEESNDGWTTVGKKSPRTPQKVQMDHWNGYKRQPSEQDYSEDVEIGASLVPSEAELTDLSNACYKLWELDLNRLIPGEDYEIDIGGGKKVYQKQDMAQGSLFTRLSKDVFRRPTFSRFCSLLDNYNPNEGVKEVVTSEERHEQIAFIEEISRTAPIKYLHNYLTFKGMVSENYQDFKRTMTGLWFDLYGRGGTSGSSSAFEHVFVGEIKREGEVSGFHNWLQFYLEEVKRRVDYQGFILPRQGEIPDSETQLLTIQFEWNGVLKSVSTTLVGVSPEFEIALYTLCFYTGGEDNYVQLGPYPVNIKCYRFGEKIGSIFPVAAES